MLHTLSVVIPTRNRAKGLSRLLQSLKEQRRVDFLWEILVIDNGSTDGTEDVVQQMSKCSAVEIRYIHEPIEGLHHGRHRGAIEARGEFIGYLDDDMVLAPTWVSAARLLCVGSIRAVAGRIMPLWETPPPGWLKRMSVKGVNGYLGLMDLGDRDRDIDPLSVWGGNCILQRSLIFDLKGFHPDGMPQEKLRYRGDGETALFTKFKLAGLKARYSATATAYHVISSDRMQESYFYRRAYNQGISDSFTAIRRDFERENPVDQSHAITGEVAGRSNGGSAMRLKISGLASFIRSKLMLSAFIDRRIHRGIRKAYQAGWQYHQDQVRNDSELLKWVLKSDYFSADLTP